MAEPCVHGEVCREYLRQGRGIICVTCPAYCPYYEPKEAEEEKPDGRHFK